MTGAVVQSRTLRHHRAARPGPPTTSATAITATHARWSILLSSACSSVATNRHASRPDPEGRANDETRARGGPSTSYWAQIACSSSHSGRADQLHGGRALPGRGRTGCPSGPRAHADCPASVKRPAVPALEFDRALAHVLARPGHSRWARRSVNRRSPREPRARPVRAPRRCPSVQAAASGAGAPASARGARATVLRVTADMLAPAMRRVRWRRWDRGGHRACDVGHAGGRPDRLARATKRRITIERSRVSSRPERASTCGSYTARLPVEP